MAAGAFDAEKIAEEKCAAPFSAVELEEAFEELRGYAHDIPLDSFKRGCYAIVSLIGSLGTAFSFVVSDLLEKQVDVEARGHEFEERARASGAGKEGRDERGFLPAFKDDDDSPEAKTGRNEAAAEEQLRNTVHCLVLDELKRGVAKTARHGASRAFQRLTWFLCFTCVMLQAMVDDKEEELSTAAWKGYEASLAHHHGFLLRRSVGLAMNLLPTRASWVESLKVGDDEETMKRIRGILENMQPVHDELVDLYKRKDMTTRIP